MFRRFSAVVVAVALAAVMISLAMAEEKFGVQVYPGAKPDAETTQFFKEGMHSEGAAYRTGDSLKQVLDFYKGQKDLKTIAVNEKGGMFKGEKASVTVQHPWLNMKTGKMMEDTLISIMADK